MKKRSKYRPKPVIQNPIEFVLSGLRPVRDLPGVYLSAQLKNRTALEQLRKGDATKEDIDMLIGAFNITEALAMRGMGRDWLDEIKRGQDALLELSRRGVSRGMRFIMTAREWESLKLVMDLHEEQLAQATVHDIEKAYDFVQAVIRQGKARAIVQSMKEEK
ncbi:hypothetical protein UFOVP652_24 [uncultured Caudovirales phage]|uniref:Uncharacterized protein n=1 Tax=uncultured Caudovirales phage TaxID=2100421 RepID=A0A6J7X1D3_9CAUD|nr:hypothetical protein UFOVP652_24 [uncultured Caudovirales phage]CAB5223928.1 hypothetical protein UFOVP734_15 [uncultured Caudovirales phage]